MSNLLTTLVAWKTYQSGPILGVLHLLILLEWLAQPKLPILPERLAISPSIVDHRGVTALRLVRLESILMRCCLQQILKGISLLDDSAIWGESSLICRFLALLADAAEEIGGISHLVHVLSRCIERALEEIARIASDVVSVFYNTKFILRHRAVSLPLVEVCAPGRRIVGPHVRWCCFPELLPFLDLDFLLLVAETAILWVAGAVKGANKGLLIISFDLPQIERSSLINHIIGICLVNDGAACCAQSTMA